MFFNRSNPPLDLEKKAEAADMAVNLMLEIALSAPVPEEQKITMRIVKAEKDLVEAAHAIIARFADPSLPESPELFETRKQVLSYLGMVTTGLKQYMQITKVPNENN